VDARAYTKIETHFPTAWPETGAFAVVDPTTAQKTSKTRKQRLA